jgi:hypothetical protein
MIAGNFGLGRENSSNVIQIRTVARGGVGMRTRGTVEVVGWAEVVVWMEV